MNNCVTKLMKVIVVCPMGRDLKACDYLRRQTNRPFSMVSKNQDFWRPWRQDLIHQHCCSEKKGKAIRQLLG